MPRRVPENQAFLGDVLCFLILLFGFDSGYIIMSSLQRPGLCSELHKTAEFPQLQFIAGHRFSCRGAEVNSHGFAVQQTMSASTVAVLLRCDRRPCCADRAGSFPRRGAEAVSYGPDPDCSSSHRHSPVAELGGSCPCLAGRAGSFPYRDAEADSHGPSLFGGP